MSKDQDKPTAVQARRAGKGKELGEHILNRRLTRKEKAVLCVLMDPNNEQRTNEDLMQLAGVSNDTFYRVKRDPHIQDELKKMSQEYVANHLAPILKASIETASKVGREGHHDRRWLAEYSGYFTPRRQVDQHVSGQIAVGVVGVSMDDV